MEENVVTVQRAERIPFLTELGLKAAEQGNFATARKIFHAVIKQLMKENGTSAQLAQLATCIASTYFHETRYDQAEAWYLRGLHVIEHLHGKTTIKAACLLVQLAELSVLQSKMSDYQKLLENAQRIYLLTSETDTRALLNCLVELSWTLCVARQAGEARYVNTFIRQIQEAERPELAEGRTGTVSPQSVSLFLDEKASIDDNPPEFMPQHATEGQAAR